MAIKFKNIDIRPILKRGEEPFPLIRHAIDSLPAGEGLSVTAPFLPSPLIEKLGSEGYRSRVEHLSGGAWVVHFIRAQE